MNKNLFLPLNAEYYDAFAAGTKACEYRVLGARWNIRTVIMGRGITISRGYGKQNRMNGIIGQVQIKYFEKLATPLQARLLKIYGPIIQNRQIICFDIRIER